MESIFSKVYSYREREKKNAKENFLTEILAHCLLKDDIFLTSFLQLLKLGFENPILIKTQPPVYDYGRPDIEINLCKSKICILIECKIEHHERLDQLEDYKKILHEKNVNERHLVYLTKYYEYKENKNSKIKFSPIRWSDIYSLIEEKNNQITQELKSFLKDENMAETKKFSYNNITTLLNITETLSKMDEVIDSIKDYFEKGIGKLPKGSSRSTRLKDNWYVACYDVGKSSKSKSKFEIAVGFMWTNTDVYVGIRIYIYKHAETEKIKELFSEKLKKWNLEKRADDYVFTSSKFVTEYVISDEEQFLQMREFLKTRIDELIDSKKSNPNIFK